MTNRVDSFFRHFNCDIDNRLLCVKIKVRYFHLASFGLPPGEAVFFVQSSAALSAAIWIT